MGKKFNCKALSKERKACGFKSYYSFGKALRTIVPTASTQLVFGWEVYGHAPSFKYLQAIAEVLKKDVSYFFD